MAQEPNKPNRQGNGLAPDVQFVKKARKIADDLGSEMRAAIVLGIGLFLFLFSIGYFQFLRIALGIIGFAMIVWGAIYSQIIAKLTNMFNQLLERFTK